MKQKSKRRTSLKYRMLKLLNTFLALVLIAMLGITLFANNLMNKMNRTDGSGERMTLEEIQSYLSSQKAEEGVSSGPAVNESDVNWGEMVSTLLGDSDDLVNILLIGQDRRAGESRARSDAMILVSVNRKTNSIVLTSFMRDLYVQIPGYGSNRLNASYAWGGMNLLNETLEQNFGIYVDGNVEVDFDQFAQIIDHLGGVEMELRNDEAGLINEEVGGSLTAGIQTLNGNQALTYARIRKLDAKGDFGRTERQRKVINALLEKVKDSSLLKLIGLVNEVLPMATTDMTNSQILGHAAAVAPILADATITSQRIPADGAYSLASVNGMSVLLADMDANREILRNTLGE